MQSFRQKRNGRRRLVAETRADCNALAADGATAAQHGGAGLGLHPRAKSVSLHAMASVRLKCALRHKSALLLPLENLGLIGKFKCVAG